MVKWWTPFVAIFAVAFITALVCTPIARLIAWKVGSVDYPGSRRINRKPTPRMGGIAVFLGLAAAFFIGQFLFPMFHMPIFLSPKGMSASKVNYTMVAFGFLAIFVTGLVDDIVTLKPLQKFAGQILAAALTVSGGLVIDVVVNPFNSSAFELGWLAYPITVIYLVAYANIFNLIDGLDGLASGIACIASATMWLVSTLAGHFDAAALSLMLTGATLGFLRYNFNPASVFLGDSGSLLIGFTLGSISLMSVQRMPGLTSIIVPLVIAGIPIIDTFSAIVRRGRAHVSIGQADKGHIHHRLMDEGYNQKQTVLVIYAWTGLLCVGSIIMTQVDVIPRIVIFVLLIILSALFSMRLHLFKPVLLHHYNPDTGADELVSPQDPEFEEEEEHFDETHVHF